MMLPVSSLIYLHRNPWLPPYPTLLACQLTDRDTPTHNGDECIVSRGKLSHTVLYP